MGDIKTWAEASVTIRVMPDAPADVFTRMSDPAIAKSYYGPMDRAEVIKHWSYNAIRNGIRDVSELDGWADVPRYAVQMDVSDVVDIEEDT